MKSPAQKKPDDYKIIGLCIYPVLTDHRPAIFLIGGLVPYFLNPTSGLNAIFAILLILFKSNMRICKPLIV